MNPEQTGGFWQSLADLAMGLTAVFALILTALLIHSHTEKEQLRQQKARLVIEKERAEKSEALAQTLYRELELAHQKAAIDFVGLVQAVNSLAQKQDETALWLAQVFSLDDCQLAVEDFKLKFRDSASPESSAELYSPGNYTLSEKGKAALESCKTNFVTLSLCLHEGSSFRRECTERLKKSAESTQGKTDLLIDDRVLRSIRKDVSALVLEGNTSRTDWPKASRIKGVSGRVGPGIKTFFGNAELGAQRARHALAHLLANVEWQTSGSNQDSIEILMSKLRIESPSFGKYQAGLPGDWDDACAYGTDSKSLQCDAARNMALRVDLKKSALRRPLQVIGLKLCEKLGDVDSHEYRALVAANEVGKRPEELWLETGCQVKMAEEICVWAGEYSEIATNHLQNWLGCENQFQLKKINNIFHQRACLQWQELREKLIGEPTFPMAAADKKILRCRDEWSAP